MKPLLSVYQYVAPLVLAPASFWLWHRHYDGDLQRVAVAWLLPILWAYVVPGIGTNVLKVWEFDVRLRLGRFRPHHGFVFGSATSMLAWLVNTGDAGDLLAVLREALVMASVLGFWNLLYDVVALRAGILRVYNQPWADGQPEAAVAMDYAPWFFGGFGAVYGAAIGTTEWLAGQGQISVALFAAVFLVALALSFAVPTLGYVLRSKRMHGHWGTRPMAKKCENSSTG